MILLLVFMQLTRDLFAIAKFLFSYAADKQTDSLERATHADRQMPNNNNSTQSILPFETGLAGFSLTLPLHNPL